MDQLENKVKQVEYIKDKFEWTEDQGIVINKIQQSLLKDMFNQLCKEHGFCNICGKSKEVGKVVIRKRYPSVLSTEVNANVCPDSGCGYNDLLVKRLQNKEDFKGVLYR